MSQNIKISVITSLYRSIDYLNYFFECYLKIENLNETELIIIHNAPTFEEIKVVERYRSQISNFVYEIVPLEGLYASWNRAILLAQGEYIANWSVDDIRTPKSLLEQSRLLDKDHQAMIVSGNYYKVFSYGSTRGVLKEDDVKSGFLNKIPKFNNGCFLMWRKKVHEEVGYFDEQFKIGGDWEFWCRIVCKYKAVTTNSLLGYYLRLKNEGISKKNNKNDIENQIINIRYYNLFLTNIYSIFNQHSIKKNFLLNNGVLYSINIKKFTFIRIVPSLLFFWLRYIVKLILILKYDYYIYKHKK